MTANLEPRPNCRELGCPHVYREGHVCMVCENRRPINVLGEPCLGCGTVLTEGNSRPRGKKGRRCLGCNANNQARYHRKRRKLVPL